MPLRVLFAGLLYVGAMSGAYNLFCIKYSPLGNVVQWSATLALPITGTPAIGKDGLVYVATGADVVCLNGTSGAIVWRYTTQSPLLVSTVTIDADGTFFVTASDCTVYAIVAIDGISPQLVSWLSLTPEASGSIPIFECFISSPVVASNGAVVVWTSTLGVVSLISNPNCTTVARSASTVSWASLCSCTVVHFENSALSSFSGSPETSCTSNSLLLRNSTVINASTSELVELFMYAFAGLGTVQSLESIDLSSNSITRIHSGAFAQTVTYQLLLSPRRSDINAALTIDPGAFQGARITGVNGLDLSSFNVPTLGSSALSSLTAQSINLSSVNLQSIHPGAFNGSVVSSALLLQASKCYYLHRICGSATIVFLLTLIVLAAQLAVLCTFEMCRFVLLFFLTCSATTFPRCQPGCSPVSPHSSSTSPIVCSSL
jgi:hypothetical protein